MDFNKILDTFTIGNLHVPDIAALEDIPIMDAVKIDNSTYGKYDMIVLSKYGTIDVLPIVLSYNGIVDPVEIPLGFLFKLPDISYLQENIEINEALEADVIPGICSSTNSQVVNQQQVGTSKAKITTALPKLQITLPAVKVNESAGTITF